MTPAPHMTLIRELALAFQAFEAYSSRHVRGLGLTMTQFDVLATLGNQPSMTCKELGEKTLILKGTMTGVLERMEQKGLIEKIENQDDGRSYRVALTKAGDRLFKKAFPEHVAHLGQAFSALGGKELQESISALKKIRMAVTKTREKSE
jgi:MarR family transcriptional regulator, 2-MHQ and catechol-resistance regulon repressor